MNFFKFAFKPSLSYIFSETKNVSKKACNDVPRVVDDIASLEEEECVKQPIPDIENEVVKENPEEHADCY